ncbi:hypothetical protein HY772_06495 [Candidatus Woesearchaeota archaeon]|nr:hypothetical protein [Candidatus Woesearchaeota archaeon]
MSSIWAFLFIFPLDFFMTSSVSLRFGQAEIIVTVATAVSTQHIAENALGSAGFSDNEDF